MFFHICIVVGIFAGIFLEIRRSFKEARKRILGGGIGNGAPQRRDVDGRAIRPTEGEVRLAEGKTIYEVLAIGVDLVAASDMARAELRLGEMADAAKKI